MKRRNALKLIPAVLTTPVLVSCQSNSPHQIKTKQNNGPIVISTWNNIDANNTAYEALMSNPEDPIDAIVRGINTVEENPDDMSVGLGGRPDREGNVTLDACIMDHQGNAGGVTYMQDIVHAISVARDVMRETPHVMLSGAGAKKFALSRGFKEENLLTPKAEKAYKKWLKSPEYNPIPNIEQHDTIGMLNLSNGVLAGGCSTSGLGYKMAGRVGDSPIIGAGLFVDGEVGACVATGLGELVMTSLSSFLVVEFMRNGMTAQNACEKATERIASKFENKKKDKQVGLIAMSKEGEIGGFSVLPGFSYALSMDGTTENIETSSYYKSWD